MKYLTQITDDAKQSYTLVTGDGDTFTLYLQYLPTQQSWMYNITYGERQINGALLLSSINAIRQFKNTLPFGLAVITNDGGDPQNIDDFTTGRIKLYVLSSAEVENFETIFFT